MQMVSLSAREARRLVLASQGIHREGDFARGPKALHNVIEHLGYIQIDTISVVERAHHHTAWNRIKNYRKEWLEQALAQQQVFEYWAHAAAYLPIRDYRFSLPRKQAFLDGDKHWYPTDSKQMRYVMDRIRVEGALQAKDFVQQRNRSDHAWGGQKPAKMALEQLFMQGDLMVAKRDAFQKVFDLSERVLPDTVNQTVPSTQEYLDHLIVRFLNANGIGTASEIAYLRKGLKAVIKRRCEELVEDTKLVLLSVKEKSYFALPSYEAVLKKKLSLRKVKILSPFDNLLIQRQRMRDLFSFDYQIECYLPAKKRRYGYFVLPILAGQQFIGRLDAKIDRKSKVMTVSNLFFETKNHVDYLPELEKALISFLRFNQGLTLAIDNVTNNGVADIARRLSVD